MVRNYIFKTLSLARYCREQGDGQRESASSVPSGFVGNFCNSAFVCKHTIQKYMRTVRSYQPRGQTWATFLRTHAAQIWACDFFQVTDLLFRPLFAFFLIELTSRKVIHVGVTRSPTDPWVARTAPGSDPVWASTQKEALWNRGLGPCRGRWVSHLLFLR